MRMIGSLLYLLLLVTGGALAQTGMPSVADYPSVQAALDANPGKVVMAPPGTFHISEPVILRTADSGLAGYGTIVQDDSDAPIVRVDGARGVRLENLTLTRAEGAQEATAPGVLVTNSQEVTLRGVRVLENHARDGAITLEDSTGCRVENCEVLNYKRVAVDDRTGPGEPLYGYAFIAIDGTGIVVRTSRDIRISGNRIVEKRLLPTPEMKEQHKLGALTDGKFPTKPGRLGEGAVKAGYVSNWHQGSALIVTSPEDTAYTRVTDNYLENCAQGIDLHCDYALVTGNTVNHGMMGVKATHGAKHLIIANNMITHVDLWGILLNPGAVSHAAEPAKDDKPARDDNSDGGTIIANNIVTDYGYGHEYWNWGGKSEEHNGSYAIALFEGQLPENPALHDVVLTGNIVYNSGQDGRVRDGEIKTEGPRYRWAVYVGTWGEDSEKKSTNLPRGLVFNGNLFQPGAQGVSNIAIP